jgi:hypothetical protein
MNQALTAIFYSYRLKIIGILLLVWSIISFFLKYANHSIWDFELFAGLFSWGLCFIFFSKEKIDDERIHYLKFRALAWGAPLGLFITHLINYFFLSPQEPDSGKYVQSISAYASFALVLLIATAIFHFLKFKDNRN